MQQEIDCFVFYFDLIGVVDEYLKDLKTIDRITKWQSDVLDSFSFQSSNTTCKTLFDNVWARITSSRPEVDSGFVLDFAGKTMALAEKNGFKKYFGIITYGSHSFDPLARTLYSGGDVTDITKQHIDTLSGTHIRAAFTEKWSAMLHKQNKHPALNSVWVSEEALFGADLWDLATYTNTPRDYNPINLKIDLNATQFSIGKQWPFSESKFQFIKPK